MVPFLYFKYLLEKNPTFGSRGSWRTLKDGCREVTGHRGQHSPLPLAALHTGKDADAQVLVQILVQVQVQVRVQAQEQILLHLQVEV